MYTTLINAQELTGKTAADGVVILDCRFSLADTSAGYNAYNQAHIPGAHYAHLDHDLSGSMVEGKSGRHPLPAREQFVERLRQWGVNDDSQVIVYDDAGGAIAARAWWMCLWVGHQACAVLDGGYPAWQRHALPVSADTPATQAGRLSLRPSLLQHVNADAVLEKGRLLVDARAAERYSGEVEPLDKLAGHIPGAKNLPFTGNLDQQGEFLSPQDLATRFSAIVEQGNPDNITHYCGSGVTAAHNVLAMMQAGLGSSALYAGSWSEWVQDDSRPVAVGPEVS